MEHFGLRVQKGSKHGLSMTRDTYAQINKRSSLWLPREADPELWNVQSADYEDEDHRFYTDAWCLRQQSAALRNYDLNLAYFASLDHDEFDQALGKVVAVHRELVAVADLRPWDGKRGLYVLVLDRYCQAYVGVTTAAGGIKARVRQHWSASRSFDRLIWGGVDTSVLSIDSFRALDTTRIFAAETARPELLEDAVINALPDKFVLNRTIGGGGDAVRHALLAGVDVVKTRSLVE